nr:hypothetical protein [Tanacetum cinerariifolium]
MLRLILQMLRLHMEVGTGTTAGIGIEVGTGLGMGDTVAREDEEEHEAESSARDTVKIREDRAIEPAKRKWQCGGSEVGKRDTSVHTAADEEVPVGGKGGDASVDSDLDNWGGWSREKQLQQVLSHLRNPANPWNTLKFLPNDQENGLHSPRREASTVGSSPPRKDIYGGAYTSSRSAPYRRGMPDDDTDGFPHLRERDNRLNFFWDAEIGLLSLN